MLESYPVMRPLPQTVYKGNSENCWVLIQAKNMHRMPMNGVIVWKSDKDWSIEMGILYSSPKYIK